MSILPILKRNNGGIRPMDRDSIIAIFIAVIGSNALWGFIQFLVQRKDNKEDCAKKIVEMIQKLDKKIDDKIAELDDRSTQRNERLDRKIDKLDNELGERGAISCRVRILKFMDEILEGWSHSRDSYTQVLQDITNYTKYCDKHPLFLNHQTEATIEYIKNDYQEHLEKNDFKTGN